MIGRTLSHFRILAKLGEGGMGVVYRAEDTRLRRQVALKVLPPELVANEERRMRFLREARAAAAVTHPNIATVHEIDEAEGVVFIAMELVEGKTLRDQIAGRPMPVREVLRTATQMAEGLARAHQGRVVHRDFKPENVIVGTDGHVKILDFGLAKLMEKRTGRASDDLSRLETISGEMTREGRIFGTASYMSPEQARGQLVDARSDIFSFGSVLYEMVTGRAPFQGKSVTDTLSAIIRDEPTPPTQVNSEVPPQLGEIIGKCLEKRPEERYQDTRDLAVDLRRLWRTTDPAVQAVRTPSGPAQAMRGSRWREVARKPAARLGGVVFLVALAATAAYFLVRDTRQAPVFTARTKLLVTDFENTTGRQDLAGPVRSVFEYMLFRSKLLEILTPSEITSLLGAASGAEVTRIDPRSAEEVCQGGACGGFVQGRIDAEGTGVRFEAKLYAAGSAQPVAVSNRMAADDTGIPAALHQLALDIRLAAGEAPGAVAGSWPPTTRSLRALELYALGVRAAQEPKEMIALCRQAIEADPDYVDGYRCVYSGFAELNDELEARRYASEARRRAEKAPEQLRMHTLIESMEASYQYEQELDLLRRFRRLYPGAGYGQSALGIIYQGRLRDSAEAEEPLKESLRLRSDGQVLWALSASLSMQGKIDEALHVIEQYRKETGHEIGATAAMNFPHQARGDWEGTLRVNQMTEVRGGMPGSWAKWKRVETLIESGRHAQAARELPLLQRAAATTGDVLLIHYAENAAAYLDSRRKGGRASLRREILQASKRNHETLESIAALTLDTNLPPAALERVIRDWEEIQREVRSGFLGEELRYARGCRALAKGDASGAIRIFEDLSPVWRYRRPNIHLARAYEAAGRVRDAAEMYEAVLSDIPRKYFERHFALEESRLAGLWAKLGEPERARRWYQQFLDDWKGADPDIPEIAEARARLAQTAPR